MSRIIRSTVNLITTLLNRVGNVTWVRTRSHYATQFYPIISDILKNGGGSSQMDLICRPVSGNSYFRNLSIKFCYRRLHRPDLPVSRKVCTVPKCKSLMRMLTSLGVKKPVRQTMKTRKAGANFEPLGLIPSQVVRNVRSHVGWLLSRISKVRITGKSVVEEQ